jgi:hypothetical protein
MMKREIGFAEAEVAGKKRATRRKRFLAQMENVVPWQRLLSAIEPHYPKGTRGDPPTGREQTVVLLQVEEISTSRNQRRLDKQVPIEGAIRCGCPRPSRTA